MQANDIIEKLKLETHPREGGWFRRTYTSHLTTDTPTGKRQLASAIYYLLTKDEPVGYLHRNHSNIVHCYHLGSPIRYSVINSSGELEVTILGPDIEKGHVPQIMVQGGLWKATEMLGGEFSLITEVVAPGFDYEDNEIATTDKITEQFPKHLEQLKPTIKF